jgi:2'-5' RNA ligase
VLRLFFALWPDPATRDALAATAARLRRTCGGRAPPAANLHLTLAFLGDVPEVRVPELADLAATLVAKPFVLELDRIGYWRQQRLVWAGPQSCPRELQTLATALDDGLRARGFRSERRSFQPHVTLLRDARRAPAQAGCGPLAWRPTQFALACTLPAGRGVRYRIAGNWSLKGAAAGL